MFPDSKICGAFTMGWEKASYIIQVDICPLLREKVWESISRQCIKENRWIYYVDTDRNIERQKAISQQLNSKVVLQR